PLSIAGHDIHVTASIGVAMSPLDGDEPETLMQRATAAAFGAKERGRNRYHFHQSELNSRALERTALIAGLRRALARGEFELHYQPEVNVQTGRIECIEAVLVSGLESGAFELEIAEPTLSSRSRATSVMEELREVGVRLAIDDFGSGGCSFADLKQMPVDTLKIAPAFVHNVTHRADDAAIVQAMITMARGLNMRVVAE